MNRREVLKRSAQVLLGIGGAALGVKAAQPEPVDLARADQTQELHVFLHTEPSLTFKDAVVKAVTHDISANGKIRNAIMTIEG